jgi:hypothetical protein
MNAKKKLVVLILAMTASAFTWPWQVPQQKEEKEAPTEKEKEEVIWEKKIVTEEEKVPGVGVAVPAPVPVYRSYTTAFKPISASSAPYSPPKPPPAAVTRVQKSPVPSLPSGAVDTSVVNIQNQIKEIIRINESLKANEQRHLAEIQRIMDQARVHQRILEELRAAKGTKGKAKPSEAEELLRQEKLRLIQEETEKNKKFIEGLEQIPGLEVTSASEASEASKTSSRASKASEE